MSDVIDKREKEKENISLSLLTCASIELIKSLALTLR